MQHLPDPLTKMTQDDKLLFFSIRSTQHFECFLEKPSQIIGNQSFFDRIVHQFFSTMKIDGPKSKPMLLLFYFLFYIFCIQTLVDRFIIFCSFTILGGIENILNMYSFESIRNHSINPNNAKVFVYCIH